MASKRLDRLLVLGYSTGHKPRLLNYYRQESGQNKNSKYVLFLFQISLVLTSYLMINKRDETSGLTAGPCLLSMSLSVEDGCCPVPPRVWKWQHLSTCPTLSMSLYSLYTNLKKQWSASKQVAAFSYILL